MTAGAGQAARILRDLDRVAAFSMDGAGGNPAGVALLDEWIDALEMQHIAARLGYSETVFAVPSRSGWSVRYFAPNAEVAFCGHATIALGAVLAERFKGEAFEITTAAGMTLGITGVREDGVWRASFGSAPCTVQPLDQAILARTLDVFGLLPDALSDGLAPSRVAAGLDHILVFLADRERLGAISYTFEDGLDLSRTTGVTTIAFVYRESDDRFHARNFFPIGGIYEDPATGAAAAAIGGYLYENGWRAGRKVEIIQGEDMGHPCRIGVSVPASLALGTVIEGYVRRIDAD